MASKVTKATLVVLEILFIGACWWIGGLIPTIPPALFFVLLGLAAFRGGRAISYNYVFCWLRDAVGIWEVADESGAGNNNEIHTEGRILRALAELIVCPICSGTWMALVLLVAYRLNSQLGLGLIAVLAAAGMAEMLHWLSESLSWHARYNRELSGRWEKNKPNLKRRKEKPARQNAVNAPKIPTRPEPTTYDITKY